MTKTCVFLANIVSADGLGRWQDIRRDSIS